MTQYSRGADFERRVKAHLEAHAWLAKRIAGSRGKVDVVGIGPGPTVVLIQCKTNARLSKADRWALLEEALPFNCVPILAYKDGKEIKYLELFDGPPMEWHP
jgi:Holliday junction resolvase